MYIEPFKLKDLPFRLSPDPQFLYLSKNHARAKAYMESTIWFTDGFVVITGEIGCGKTTLIETFLRELEKDIVVAQIAQTQVSAIEFLQSVLVQFGFSPFKMKKAELIATLNGFLVEQYASGRKVLLIVDEAQNLSLRVLEEVRMLSGVETTKDKVLRIILAGQPELNEKLDSPELTQLAQRVRLRFHLTPLTEQEMNSYILHRLEVAGSQGREIFAADTFPLIYRYTGGVPRLINSLCETALMAGFTADRDHVTVKDVMEALEELQWTEYSQRRAASERVATAGGLSDRPHIPDDTDVGFRRLPLRAARGNGNSLLDAADTDVRPGPQAEVFARLMVATDGQTTGHISLHAGRLIIGRTADNDLQIDSRFVSRHHCQIVTTRQSCVIEDLNSTNGIFVKSKRVRQHHLNDGDVVTIGKHELLYIDERTPGTRARQDEDTVNSEAPAQTGTRPAGSS